MQSAKEMFEELGYHLKINDNDYIMYNKKTDYIDYSVWFKLNYKTYHIDYMDWWDNKSDGWVPMEERETEWLKHCARYGHWQKVDYDIGIDIHKAINQQILELGWK
ncbi:MAG: hypothetical protein IKQ33_01755 [Clostridia bacterium]|nr:hypothetical protein [Clostridia bacterium]